jgi:hypothetical protein
LGSRNNQNNRRRIENLVFDLAGNAHATCRHRFTVKNHHADTPTINSAVKGTHEDRCGRKFHALNLSNIRRGLVAKC